MPPDERPVPRGRPQDRAAYHRTPNPPLPSPLLVGGQRASFSARGGPPHTSQAIVAQALTTRDPALLALLSASALSRLPTPRGDQAHRISDDALKDLRADLLKIIP